MSFSTFKARITFQMKVLVPVVTVLVLLIAAAMWVVNQRITTQVRTEAARQLETANAVFTNTRVMRAENFFARFRGVMEEASFKATIASGDSPTIIDHLHSILTGDGDA